MCLYARSPGLLPCSATAGRGLRDRTARRKRRAVSDSHAEFTAALAAASRSCRSVKQAAESERFCARHSLPPDRLAVRTNTYLLPARKAIISQTLSRSDAPAACRGPQGEFAQCLSALLFNSPNSP